MKESEKIKLDNFKAHYRNILSNIQIANDELEESLSERDSLLGSLIDLKEQRDELSSEVLSLLNTRDGAIAQNKHERERIKREKEEANQSIKTDRQSLEDFKELTESTIKKAIREHAVIAREIEFLAEKKEALEEDISELSRQYENQKGLMDEIVLRTRSGKENLAQIERKEAKTIEGMKKEKSRLIREISGIRALKEKEENSIVMANEHFAKKERELDRRERDILTVSRRLKQLYQEVKPGIALKI